MAASFVSTVRATQADKYSLLPKGPTFLLMELIESSLVTKPSTMRVNHKQYAHNISYLPVISPNAVNLHLSQATNKIK